MEKEYDPASVEHLTAMKLLQKAILSSGRQPLIIDCGANIGLSSVWLSEQFSQALIIAIEPELENYKILERNSQNFSSIVPIRAAISDDVSYVTLSNETGRPWAWKTEKSLVGEIETLTVASIREKYPDFVPFIIKIDIEGFEVDLLKTNNAWIDEFPLVVFEMHDWMNPWSGSGHSFLSALTRKKRDYLIIGENVFAFLHASFDEG